MNRNVFTGLRACVDSGQHRIGWAFGDGSRVLGAGLWRDDLVKPQALPKIHGCVHVVQEVPKVYPGPRRGRKRVDPNVLVGIAAKSGWLCGEIAPGALYVPIYPRDWKGTVNGDTFLDTIRNRLRPDELAILAGCGACDSLLHNVIDAMGMVLWTQKRL